MPLLSRKSLTVALATGAFSGLAGVGGGTMLVSLMVSLLEMKQPSPRAPALPSSCRWLSLGPSPTRSRD